MFWLFGGKVLLRWDVDGETYQRRFDHYPLWMQVVLSVSLVCLLESLCLVVLSLLIVFFRLGATGFSTGLLITIFKFSFGIGVPLGIISAIVYMAPNMMKDRVIIRDRSINVRYKGQEQRFKFNKFDFYAFSQSDDEIDGQLKRNLVLVNEKKQDGFLITLPSEISEEMIDEVMQGRLIRDDKYGGELNFDEVLQ